MKKIHPLKFRQGKTYWEVTEFFGAGDMFFGGDADDRPLGNSGEFLTGCYRFSDIAQFPELQSAERAADKAKKRNDSIISIVERH